MSSLPKRLYTPEEYLAMEREAEYKSEYYDGFIVAMSGVQRQHDGIAWNVNVELGACLRSRPCQGFTSDMRVRIQPRNYVYPDASALCGEPEFAEDSGVDTLLNPSLIVEVLSRSTEAHDRGEKFDLYRQISSLREYLLLASNRMHADLFVKQPSGSWVLTPFSEPGDVIVIESIGCKLTLASLYDKVRFDVDRGPRSL